jgi:hypothetical protein
VLAAGEKKREKKQREKEEKKQEHLEKQSQTSHISKISRSDNGRFEAKYKVGDKAADKSLIREVFEEEWQFIERDKHSNCYFKCLKCSKAARVLKGDRKKHSCKGV